jgi:AcrR family transcriptional regulator
MEYSGIGELLRQMIADGLITDPASPKGRLLAAAAKLFREKGYSRTTVRTLAAEVGILSGSIFHHFKSKDEILFGVMNEVVAAMTVSLKTALSSAIDPRAKVRALISNELMFIHGKTGDAVAVLVYEWRALSAEKQALILKDREIFDKLWFETLEEARHTGLTVVESDILRHLIHGAIAWSLYWYDEDGQLTMEELIDRTLTLAIKG